jgi:hypothetical protein
MIADVQRIFSTKVLTEINEWRWEKDKIEEVKEFKSLGYVMNDRNPAAAHGRAFV